MVTFDSAVDEGACMNDLTLPSSSPVKNRGIFWEERGRAEARAGEMIRAGGEKRVKREGYMNSYSPVMETALKELEKLQKLTSDDPSTSISKTPAIQELEEHRDCHGSRQPAGFCDG